MNKVTKIINKILDFSCEIDGEEILFTGILQKDEYNNIVINARTTPPEHQKMRKHHDLNICAKTNGYSIVCLNAYIKDSIETYYDGGEYNGFDYSNLIILPDKIIMGEGIDGVPNVKKISAIIPELNYFFMYSSPLDLIYDFSKENPSVLNFTSLKKISAKDEYGKVKIWRTFLGKESVNEISFKFLPYASYEFFQEIKLDEAIERLASIRNLFSFFADGYIGLEEISFWTSASDKECFIWMNYGEKIKPVQERFCVTFEDIANDFQNIWSNWVGFYDKSQPLMDLFYEIICERSTEINEFLGFAKAVEIYSDNYQADAARSLEKKETRGENRSNTPVRFIYQNLLEKFNNILEIYELDIKSIAKALSKIRNYYTHYNSKKLSVKPSHREMFSATRILHCLLLAIIYESMGMPCSFVKQCKKKRIQFLEFDQDINCLKNFYNKNPSNY